MTLDQYLTTMKMSDAAFGKKVGYDRTTVSRWRRCETRPDWHALKEIKQATGGCVMPNDFIGAPASEGAPA
jgi:hypothetical protein